MDRDDLAYRRSVRNMSLVLAAIVLTIFAALYIPPYFASPGAFQASVSADSPYGFALHLTLNSTAVSPLGGVLLTGSLNSTDASVNNVTSADAWALPQAELRLAQCTAGWPLGLGVMQGHYTQDNYSFGTLLPLVQPSVLSPASSPPQFFLFYPRSSEALAVIGGDPFRWTINVSLSFGPATVAPGGGARTAGGLPPGVYTAVLADEWGDVLTTNFRVT